MIVPLWIFCCQGVTSNALFLKKLIQKVLALFCFQTSSTNGSKCALILAAFPLWIILLTNIIDVPTQSSGMIDTWLPCWHIDHRLNTRGQNSGIKRISTGSLPFFFTLDHLGACSQAVTTLLTHQNVSLKKLVSEFNHWDFLQMNVWKLGCNTFQSREGSKLQQCPVLDTSLNTV